LFSTRLERTTPPPHLLFPPSPPRSCSNPMTLPGILFSGGRSHCDSKSCKSSNSSSSIPPTVDDSSGMFPAPLPRQPLLQAPPAAEPTRDAGDYNCHRITTQGNLQFRYKGDTEFVAVEEVDQRRLRQYDSRNLLTALDDEADAAAGSGSESGQGGARDASPAVLRMHASDTAIDACRCAKDDRKRVAVRKYAGVFVVSLPCGHIVFLHHMVGSESLPQVAYSFAKARELLPNKTFLCYDNACALARYCRNKKRPDSGPLRAAFAPCVFFLPCSHVKNHTACLNPGSSYYLPEVLKEKHEVLTDVNTEVQEQVPCLEWCVVGLLDLIKGFLS